MKKNRKNSTKSLLACAVLASVLGGGMVPVQAASVNAVVAPKDFSTLNGKSIAFGQQLGYVAYWNRRVTYRTGTPTWQIVSDANGNLTLLACDDWGYNRYSDKNGYSELASPNATIQQLYYREVLKYLNEDVATLFTSEELSVLQEQISIEMWWQRSKSGTVGEYSGIFALPTTGQVNALGAEKRKRGGTYWLAECAFKCGVESDKRSFDYHTLWLSVNTVQTDGSIVQQPGQVEQYFYPTIAFRPITFVYYNEKLQSDTFKSQNVTEPSAISSKNLTFKDTDREKNVNITKLSVTQEGIAFDAAGLATGEGQGIGGLVEDADGNYLAYARLANGTDGTAQGKIKFNSSITGSNTIHLFNEWIGTSYDLLGNYYEMYVNTENAKISAFTNKWDVTYDELTIGKGVNYTAEGSSNVTAKKKFIWENSNGEKLVNITNVDNGYIHLGGAFSVENSDNATVTNRTLKLTKTGNVWNDIVLYRVNGGVMAMNVDLNSLYMDGGTFIIQGNLKATDYLQLCNGAELTIGGTVEAKRLEVNGTLNLVADGAVTRETHLCNNSTLNLTGSNKILNLQKSLTADDGAKITGIDSTDKVEIFENLTAKGNITLDKITLEVGNNIQIQGNLNGDAVISANKIEVKGNINANSLIVKNFFDLANGNAQSGTIGTLTFGESGKTAIYDFDVGQDKFTITNSASGIVRLVPKYGTNLSDVAMVDVFSGSNDKFSGLTLQDARVTDIANKQTYILTQDTDNKGKLKVTASKHKNAVMNVVDAVKGQKIVFGNYWQEDTNGDGKADKTDAKQPVVWSLLKQDMEQSVFLSDKILDETGGGVLGAEMWRITNFLKENGNFVKELFTASELAVLNVANGDALALLSLEDVKNGGNYGWNANSRKAQVSSYAGNGGRWYALSSTHSHGKYSVNDWVDSVYGDIGTSGNMWFYFGDGSHYGIRPTISFDTFAVLFATNAEGGKGSTGKGQITLLKKVESNSTLELTLDDAYIAQKKTGMRLTGDIQLTQLDLCGDALTVQYRNGVWFDRKNSYLSYFVGEGDAAADYFAYGKAGGIALGGSGISGKIKLDSVKDAAVNDRGMALTFFNEYGEGTSWAGSFAELPGSFTFNTDGNLVYTADIADIPSIGLVIGENNILKVMGSSYAGTVSINTITGKGTIQVAGDFTFSGDNHSFQGVLEVLDDHTLTLTGNDLYYSIIGSIKLQQDTIYRGTKLAGTVSSATGTEQLKLINDLKIGANLSIENLDAQDKTLDMRDMEGTTNYDILTIGKLWSNANLAIDVGKINDTDTDFVADKIVLNGVVGSAKITLNAINLIDNPQLTSSNPPITIGGVVTDNVGSSVVVADGLEAYASYYKYTVSLDGDGNLTLAYDGMNPDGFKTFVKNTKTASYSFVGDTTLDGPVTTGSEGSAGSATNITKTVFLNGHTLNSHTSSTPPDPLPNGITVADTHTLTMVGGTISGFATALTVNKTDATNFGTLNLKDVTFSGNTTDVANAGTMNIHGSVTMQKLTGDGTTEIQSGAELNLGDATATALQTFEQTFKGDGTLNFKGNTTIAVTKLGISTDNLAVTIAKNKILSLTGSGTDTLIKNIGGAGKINIANGNTITTDASNLQVSEVANVGTLKIKPASGNETKINSLKTNITGATGSLELHGFNEAHGTITQNTVTIAQDSTLDAYKKVTANITNYGATFFFVGDLQGDVTNVLPPAGSETFTAPGGSTLLNGLVALYTDTDNRTLQKKITDGYIGIMGEVISDLNNLAGEVYIAAGHTLTLQGGASGSAANITQPIQGAESKMTGYGNGNLVTDGYFTADLDKVQVPLENRGEIELSAATITDMSKMISITNSGNLAIGADITLDGNISNSGAMNINGCTFSGEMTNSGTSAKVTFDSTSTISGQIENSGTVEIKTGNTFETATAKVTGGKLILDGNYTFSNANIQGLTELYVNGATYNFNAELGATPSVELIDAEKVTGPTLNLGTVTATSNETLSEWELGETKIAPYLKDNIGNTVAVGNTAVVFSGDNYRFTFSQAKDDGGTPIIGSLAIIKENGGELWQIVRNTEVSGYPCGNVATYSLTGDYTEQMKGATTDTNKLGTLTPVSPATSRTLTIEGNGHFFAGNGKNGITVGNADDVLNFNNISEIKNWSSYIVTNNDGTVNFNNVTKLSSPVINTSGTVNFNGTTEVNSTLSGNGTFNNNGELTVTNTGYLEIDELTNNGIIKINGGVLSTKITGGILKIAGPTLVAVAGVAEGAAKLDVREIDIEPDSELLITGHTSTLGEMWIDNAGTLKLDIDINKAFICGGKVVIEKDGAHGPFITTQSILADEIILGDSGDIDPDTLNVTGDTDDTVLAFGKISGIHDNVKLNITKGKVYALDEVNGKIILGENVSLDIDADNIKKNVEIGTNANLNLGDGTLKTTTITGTNNGTVNFLGKVAVETGTSIPKATFKNGSTLVLDAKTDTAPLTITTEINIDSGAKLYVNGAEKNGTYKIVFGTPIDSAFEGWTLSNIRGRDAEGKHLVKGESFSVDSNVYSIVFKTAVPENSDIANVLENADGTPLMDWAEKVCDAFDTAYGDAGEAYTANAINSMASASVLAGAQKGAATMVTQVAGNISANVGVGARGILSGVRGQVSGVRNVSADVNDSASMRAEVVETGLASEVMPTEYKDKVYDKQVWASYIHSKQKIDGLKTGALTQNSTIQLNGVTVGADLWSGKKSFGGLAITYADGNANSAQMSNSTKNEAKYYGISMYHRQDMGKYALTTDIGYTYNKNDITQHTTGITDEVTSKPKTHAYTVGMKLERETYLSKACKIVPFAGARYTRLQNRDFSNSLGANTKVDNQNLVTVPVGLSFHSHLITTEGWKLGSILEGGYEWNFGNRHSTQEFGYGGAYNSIGFDVVDRGQYFVKAALTADNENMFFELGYRYSKGKSVRDNKWNFNANFIF